ncbi:hypothetical protein KFE25_001112 [Diacronema lutheri]|mgnify:CR=1 FL=1|uniref:SCP2 domain-containing protein n=1 Tax=Diacronema lutheri TaxID=2081491 RepID=A0A8J5X838_DIALT|nr:hypothetical protein KFE25_001112 [Diacronema lutheri]
MGGVCSRRIHVPPPAGEMTVAEAFALLDGAPAKGARGAFLFEVGLGADAHRFLLSIEEAADVARVRDARGLSNAELPSVACSLTYKSPSLFFAEARGKLPVSAYVTGQVRVSGNVKAAEALEPVWEPLMTALRERDAAGGAAEDLDDAPLDAAALGLAAEPRTPWYALHTRAWWVRHWGTDNLQGGWLTLLGTLLWFGENVLIGLHGGSGFAWAQAISAGFFLVGFGALLDISYPERLGAMLTDVAARSRAEELAAKQAGADALPRPSERSWGWRERLGLTNSLGQGVVWMTVGLLPFPALAVVAFALAGAGSAVGWALLGGTALFVPPMVLLIFSASEASMRDMARGGSGSRVFFDWARRRRACVLCCSCCCCGSGSRAEAFEHHLGTDSKAGLWYFFGLMCVLQLLVTMTLFFPPLSWRTYVEFSEATLFTVGLGLQLRANYPEYANESLLFGRLVD